MKRRTFLAATLLTLPVLGCGGGRGSLSGTVKRKNRLLSSGTISAIGTDNVVVYGPIQTDGSYSLTGVRNGTVKVAVECPNPAGTKPLTHNDEPGGAPLPLPGRGAVAAAPVAGWFEIPLQYSRFEESGLTVDVSGATTFEINMND
ncbi:hypothetical protein BH11PLA2_BH11PLA2_06550 [soil metagenome]